VTREDVADPAISVVVPAFNRETTLSVTLDSLLAQTYTAWEAIVVDDGSSDGTAALAERYAARDSRIRVHRQANAGVSGARNRGIELARAAWLFFLDADDWIVPTAFEALTDALAADPEADVAYGGYVRVDDAGREVEPERPKHEADFFPVFARTCAMAVHTCLVRAQLVRDVGGFDADLVTCEDWDLWQRIARMGARFVGVPDYIARYRLRLGSASGRGSRMLADGLRVIDRGHGDDPRLPTAPPRAPLPSGAHEAARTYYVCYAAGLEIAHGHDPCALLVEVGEGLSGDVDPHGVGETLFHAVAVGRACGHDGWAGLPSDVHRECDRFIDALGEEVGSHWLAHGARLALERLVLGVAREERPRTVGRWHLIQLDLAAEPPQDLALDGAVTRVICDVRHGDRPIGSVEAPVIDGWLPALVLADAIVANSAWDVLRCHLEAYVYPTLSIDASAERMRAERDGAVVFDGPSATSDDPDAMLHDTLGWTMLLQELFELPTWTSDAFYAERDDAGGSSRIVAADAVALDLAEPIPALELQGRNAVDLLVAVAGVPVSAVRCDARRGRVSPQRIRRAIVTQLGFELCRAVVREGVVLAPADATGSLRQRLALALERRAGAPAAPAEATTVGRGAGADGTAVSRWNVLPVAAAGERIALAELDGDPIGGRPEGGTVARLLCGPALLDVSGAGRQPSDDATLRLLGFESIFSAGADPWSYESEYEQEKYRQTLALLPEHVEDALELGCAEGVFTRMLAERVRSLTAADISPRALARARERCDSCRNVSFVQLDLFEQQELGRYDLVVCSELLYYAPDVAGLQRAAATIAAALDRGAHLLSAHAHALVDEEHAPGFDWDVPFGAAAIERALLGTGQLDLVREIRTLPYRVQLYRRRNRRRLLPARRRVACTEATAGEMAPEHAARFRPRGGSVWRDPAESAEAAIDSLPILMYHRVAPDGDEATRRFRLHPDAFEQQLRLLREQGYRSLTFDQWRAAADRRAPLPARSVILTFDDGYADFPTYTLPLLRRYGFQATMFVVTDLVGGSNLWDERIGERLELMDWSTLLSVREQGVELGSHSSAHRPLVSLSAAELTRDLCRSRACLQERTGAPVRSVCYPYGLNDVTVRSVAAACGFHYGVTTDEWCASFGDDLLGLPRLEVRGTDSLEAFAAMLEE